jgi:very-short-patch-repair endonuclease
LKLAGWDVIRCTWHQLIDDPDRLIHTIRTLLLRNHPPTGQKRPNSGRNRPVGD